MLVCTKFSFWMEINVTVISFSNRAEIEQAESIEEIKKQ